MEEQDNYQVASTIKAMNDFNLLQIRLDTSQILEQVKMFLNAEIEIVKEVNGQYLREVLKVGEPKANKKGVASILNWVQMSVNPQVVQGNFPLDKKGLSIAYNEYIESYQKNLGQMLMVNIYDYDIREEEYEMVIDSLMNIVIPFMSRLIGDKERSSYGETFREVTSATTQDRRKNAPIFKQ